MNNIKFILSFIVLVCLFSSKAFAEEKYEGNKPDLKCHLKFSLSGWSAIVKRAKGAGRVTCENGQSKAVKISVWGGGATFGKSKITNGSGTFSGVKNFKEIFGSYATSEAHGGVVESGSAQALTKGNVSLALHGTGKGVDIGIAFGSFKISPK